MRTRVAVTVSLLMCLAVPTFAANEQTATSLRARLQAQANVAAAKGAVAAYLTFNGAKLDVLAYSWGASNSGPGTIGGGAGAGKVNVQDLSIVRFVGAGSQEFLQGLRDRKALSAGNAGHGQ